MPRILARPFFKLATHLTLTSKQHSITRLYSVQRANLQNRKLKPSDISRKPWRAGDQRQMHALSTSCHWLSAHEL